MKLGNNANKALLAIVGLAGVIGMTTSSAQADPFWHRRPSVAQIDRAMVERFEVRHPEWVSRHPVQAKFMLEHPELSESIYGGRLD